ATPHETPRPAVRRVDADPDPTGSSAATDPAGSGLEVADASDPEAARLLTAAEEYAREHPDDPWGALLRYRELGEARPELAVATRAQVSALEGAVQRAGDQAYEQLTLQVLALVREQRFAAALALT